MTSPFNPLKSAAENLAGLRNAGNNVFLVNTGPRDTGQSDFKNRLTFHDLMKLPELYEQAGYFAVEMHGGARFHQDMMHNKVSPFREALAWKNRLRHTMTQTLIRSTNVWGYRAYPANVIKRTVESFLPTIDVWRCFDFLNHIPNMIPAGEAVLNGGKIFEPSISYTWSPEATDEYYLKVAGEIVDTFGGQSGIILAIKDMAGVAPPAKIAQLIDKMLQRWPDLVINYHRHSTDGLGVPAVVEAAAAGARIIDITDDAFSRFYGQPPVQAVAALLRERGIEPWLDMDAVHKANDVVRSFIQDYEPFESPYKGFSYDVTAHRMPGGAFPSSFEQAEKGGFLKAMPSILKGMALGNRIIHYFDVTPGSQISWTTWAAIIQRLYKDGGDRAVQQTLTVLSGFVAGGQDFDSLPEDEKDLLLALYAGATDDLKNLLMGAYGPLPFGWPADWVYQSAFGPEWQAKVDERRDDGPHPRTGEDEDIEASLKRLQGEIGRSPTEEELILYMAHPQAAVDFLIFRETYGDTTVLPTAVWFNGLHQRGCVVDFELNGKPHHLELVIVGETGPDGMKPVVLAVDNTLMEFTVEMPEAAGKSQAKRVASRGNPGEIGATVKGNLWRVGNRTRVLAEGDHVDEGEEVANLEVMKTENAVFTPIAGTVSEMVAEKNDTVEENQLLMVITPDDE
jgi:pyruvate carboxylase